MPPLSSEQLLNLASKYAQFGQICQRYQSARSSDESSDVVEWSQDIGKVTRISNNLADDGLATIFNDANSAYTTLSNTTQKANEAATALAAQRDSYSRAAAIASAMIDLAGALGGGIAGEVFKGVAKVAAAANA